MESRTSAHRRPRSRSSRGRMVPPLFERGETQILGITTLNMLGWNSSTR